MTKKQELQVAIDRGIATGLGSGSMDPMAELVYEARRVLDGTFDHKDMQPDPELEACKTSDDYCDYFTRRLNMFSEYREGLARS